MYHGLRGGPSFDVINDVRDIPVFGFGQIKPKINEGEDSGNNVENYKSPGIYFVVKWKDDEGQDEGSELIETQGNGGG